MQLLIIDETIYVITWLSDKVNIYFFSDIYQPILIQQIVRIWKTYNVNLFFLTQFILFSSLFQTYTSFKIDPFLIFPDVLWLSPMIYIYILASDHCISGLW